MKTDKFLWITLTLSSLFFFYKTIIFGLLPIPADALVGLYHPFRDYFSDKFPQGAPYKNFILTDPVLQQYPWKWLAIRTLLEGESLGESPYSFGGWGASSIENIQAGTFYPMNILFFLINDFSAAWTAFIIVQPILASLFMFWWLKHNGIKQIAAIFGGLVWAFSSFNLVWLEWGNIGHAGLYLPLTLLAVDKLKVKSEKLKVGWKRHALLQFSLAASLLAGHWQITLYLLVAVGLYLLMNRKFSLFIIHYSLLIVLTSFQWVPVWRFIRESNRQVEQENVLTREGFFISPKHLAQLIAPDFFGNPATGNYRGEWNYAEQAIYIGIIPLVLALSGALTKQNKMLNLQRFGLLPVLAGLMFAVRNPIAEIPYKLNIPIWSDLQPTRLSYLITFGLSILAAVGLENLIVSFNRSLKNTAIITGGLGAMFLTLLIASSKFNLAERTVSQRNLIWPVFIWGLFGMFYTLLLFIKRFNLAVARLNLTNLIVCLLLLVVVFDLFRFGWKFTPFSPPEYLYPVTPAIKFLQENMGPRDKYMTLDRRILPPNANIMYKLKSIEGYDPIYSKQYALLVGEMESGVVTDKPQGFGRIVRPANYKSPVTALLGVRYLLSLADLEEKEWVKVFQEGETRIYERR